MRYNPTMFRPISGHADLAEMIAELRDIERREKTKYPMTVEAVIRQWEETK